MPYIGTIKVSVEKSWTRPNLKKYSVEKHLSDNPMSTMRKVFLWPVDLEHYKHSLEIIGPVGTRLINALNEIAGIDMIFLETGSVSIVKDSDYLWKKIEPKILVAIKTALEGDPVDT